MTSSIFNVDQLNMIRDAHLAWCAEHSVDPKSPLGEEAVGILLKAFGADCSDADCLLAALDRHIERRGDQVRLGSPGITS
jgi:hypothetical protein